MVKMPNNNCGLNYYFAFWVKPDGCPNGSLWSKHVADSVFYCIFTIFERTGDLNSTVGPICLTQSPGGSLFPTDVFIPSPDTIFQMAARVRVELKSSGRRFPAARIRAISRRRHSLFPRHFPRWRFLSAATFYGSQMNNLPGNKKPRNNCRWSSFDGSGCSESGAIMDS